jgi:metallo-beta-lactamase class B
VFLANHPEFADLHAKRRRVAPGGPNPFVEPGVYGGFLTRSEQAFEREFAEASR